MKAKTNTETEIPDNQREKTHVLWPSCCQHRSGQRQSCRGGRGCQGVPIARNPWFQAQDRREQREERICWSRSHCSRPRYVPTAGRWFPCRYRPARYRAHRRRLPRTWHLLSAKTNGESVRRVEVALGEASERDDAPIWLPHYSSHDDDDDPLQSVHAHHVQDGLGPTWPVWRWTISRMLGRNSQ